MIIDSPLELCQRLESLTNQYAQYIWGRLITCRQPSKANMAAGGDIQCYLLKGIEKKQPYWIVSVKFPPVCSRGYLPKCKAKIKINTEQYSQNELSNSDISALWEEVQTKFQNYLIQMVKKKC